MINFQESSNVSMSCSDPELKDLQYNPDLKVKQRGDIDILERKHVNVVGVIHIGKESNNLEESEFLGVDDTSYETYEDVRNLDKKFKKIAPSILKLKSKDVKKCGISKQTLWNIKRKIGLNQVNRISNKIKIQLVCDSVNI